MTDRRLQYLRQLARNPGFWNLEALRFAPRHRQMTWRLLGKPLLLADSLSTYWALRGIFLDRVYAFEASSPAPRILDVGANIGLSVIFFKQLYPQARITAFEPDPQVFALLERNLRTFGLEDVELVNKAAWTEDGTLPFAADGADGGHLTPARSNLPVVPTTRLRAFLGSPVDLLKMDVEGAETAVLEDCAGRLEAVRLLFVEYHSRLGERQTLGRLFETLGGAGFRVLVRPGSDIPAQPFLAPRPSAGMDLQLDVYAYRDRA